ncbi:MAG TPA: TMEM175 family protein [Streptosporangiaceae bacterium]
MDRSRLESFSDGVFSVAITLLALDLAIAGPGGGHTLLWKLGHQWPAFVAYLISFFGIGIIWVNHHALMSNVVAVTRPLLYINLVLLAVVVAIPFATSTMADYLTATGQDQHVAAALYAGIFELMGLAFSLVFEWMLRHDECLHDPLPAPAKNRARLRFYAGQIPYLIAIGVAFLSAWASLAIVGLVAAYYIFERTLPLPSASRRSAR